MGLGGFYKGVPHLLVQKCVMKTAQNADKEVCSGW